MENDSTNQTTKQKPHVFFKDITFNDGTTISLNHNSIVVFTGANNCGKSQVLKDAEKCLDSSDSSLRVVLTASSFDFSGDIDELGFWRQHFYLDKSGKYNSFQNGYSLSLNDILKPWKEKRLRYDLHHLFIKRISTEQRLTVSNALQRSNNPEKHPICKLSKSEELAQKVSNYFRDAFDVDLVVNRSEMQTIPLHVGQSPNKDLYTISKQDDYYSEVRKLPKLQEQGDGMRSFASILLDTFTSEYSITLIDEPEAFLHPPQARILGKMLATNNPVNRQLFISTHSEDLLQGLLDADNENVTIIRINRDNNINKMNVLQSNEIRKLWSNPILRYSNILSGLFHAKVVVCESDYDCLFYQAVINAVYESKKKIAPDLLFTHCGGKTRMKDVVAALKAVNVPVVAICDFDLLNNKMAFKSLTDAFGIEWETNLSEDMKQIYDTMNSIPNSWKTIKTIGKAGFSGNAPAAYEKVETVCTKNGLFVVPVGEMESFDKTVNKEKKEWVYEIIENRDLACDSKLENVRQFIQQVVNYTLSDNN